MAVNCCCKSVRKRALVRQLCVVVLVLLTGQLRVGHSQAVNLARSKTAYQITTYWDWSSYRANFAVDGSKDSCSSTGTILSPWWAVDLGQKYSIIRVTVIVKERGVKVDVGVTNNRPQPGQQIRAGDYILCGQLQQSITGETTVNQRCSDTSSTYQYVIVNSTFPRADYLSLCEVEVYGFACDTNCAAGCNKAEEGRCDDKCKPGFVITTAKICAPCDTNCAAGCDATGEGSCDDNCKPGFVNTATRKCARCDVNCASGCNTAGAARCDGPCYGGFYLLENKTCVPLVNLALRKPAYQISNYENTYYASRSVDGSKNDILERGSCSHTDGKDGNPWWAVDLGDSYTIIGVNITSRGDYYNDERLDYVIVGLANYQPVPGKQITLGNYTLCGQYPEKVPIQTTIYQSCPPDLLTYRYVIIQTDSNRTVPEERMIDMCEVEVFGFECDPQCLVGCGLFGRSTCNGDCANGFGPTAAHTCQECDANCSSTGCNKAGGGLCDGPCSQPYVLSSDLICELPKAISSSSIGAIVGGVLGEVLLAVLVVVLIVFLRRRKKEVGNELVKPGNDIPMSYTKPNAAEFPTGTAVQLKDLAEYIKQLQTTDGFKDQFNDLPKDDLSLCVVGSLPENKKKKNRFGNILPYDTTRVRVFITEDDQPEEAYINASFIKEYNGDQIAYIAAQAPLAETVDLFWEMIWQQNISCIVALVLTFEDCKSRCHAYWPESTTEKLTFGRFTIELLEVDVYSEFIRRKLSIHVTGQSRRTLTQFQYLVWPDKGVPEHVWSLIAFRNRVRSFMPKSSTSEDRLMIHCSAGVGRTGTFIALDILLDEAVQTGWVDVFEVVKSLRLQRMKCVQTSLQYELLYLSVLDAYITGVTVRRREELDSLSAALRGNKSAKTLQAEYEKLMQLRPAIPPDEELVALNSINVHKNRVRDIVPTTESSRCLLPIGSDQSDYINASKAKGYKTPQTYILTQLPLSQTVGDFWNMIVVEKCTSVVLLQQGSAKDPPFYPKKAGDVSTFGDTEVILKSVKYVGKKSIVLYTMAVRGKVAGEDVKLEIRLHELLSSWKTDDNNPNDVDDILELINLVNDWERQHYWPDRRGSSVVVQCLDGATRSGLYAATSLAVDRLNCDNELDVFYSCRCITSVRPRTITSQAQFDFIYRAAVKSLTWKPSFCHGNEQLSSGTSDTGDEHLYGNINSCDPKMDTEALIYANSDSIVGGCSSISAREDIYVNCGGSPLNV